jgi:RNA polymerase sigma-70 factor (ECF subfamily)
LINVSRVASTCEFEGIVREHWSHLLGLIARFERDRDSARDLTQECFCRAWKGWPYFRGDASPKTWLSHIAMNIGRDHARRRTRRQVIHASPDSIPRPQPALEKSPEATLITQERIRAVWAAAQSVSPQQLKVLQLRFLHDLTVAEIAEALGTNEGTVKTQLFRALESIRKRLRHSGHLKSSGGQIS